MDDDLSEVSLRELSDGDGGGDGRGCAAAGAALLAALERHGMCYLRLSDDDGDAHSVRRGLDAAQRLFQLPDVAKAECAVGRGDGLRRGYFAAGAESGGSALERKEGFCVGAEQPPPTNAPLHRPNSWPAALSRADRHALLRVHALLCDAAERVGGALARALGDERWAAWRRDGRGDAMLRCFHYLGTRDGGDSLSEVTASSTHTDWGYLTVIAAERGRRGLQRSTGDDDGDGGDGGDGAWRDVAVAPERLLVNAGDFACLASGGRLRSPRHRVILDARPRLSFVLFFYPPAAVRLAECADAEAAAHRLRHTLSVFSDQRGEERGGSSVEAVMNAPFGELMAEKWQQVARSS